MPEKLRYLETRSLIGVKMPEMLRKPKNRSLISVKGARKVALIRKAVTNRSKRCPKSCVNPKIGH